MGGSLALYLAEKHPEIKGIILINNALIFKDFRMKFLPIIKNFIRTIPVIGSDIKDSSKKEICYERVSTKSLIEFVQLLNEIKKVKQPIIIFKSKEKIMLFQQSV